MRTRCIWAVLSLGLLWPAGAGAAPASGPRETVDIASSTPHPNTSAALSYTARYHAPNDPDGDPPALRHLRIELPPGTGIDTSVPERCTASDDEIRLRGESACPPGARIGAGWVRVKQFGLGVETYPTVIYNAKDDMLELVKSGDRVLAVVHTYVRGTTLEGPVPTCATGGNPPMGCPFDQLTLLANHLQVEPITRGGRNYGTTPPTCPASGRWEAPVTLTYGDGSVDRVTPYSPCLRFAAARPPRVVTLLGLRGLLPRRVRGDRARCAARSFLAAIAGTRRTDVRHVDFRLTRAGRTLRFRRDARAPHTMRIVRRGLVTGRAYRVTATLALRDGGRVTRTRTFRAC